MMNKTSIDESQNLEDGSDRETKKESDRVHVSTCLQRDSETREYTKADNGLSHNLAPPRLLAKCTLKQSATPLLKRIL